MAKPIDELVIQIKADTRQLQKDLDSIKGKLKTTGATGAGAFAGAGVSAGLLSGQLKKLAGPAAIGAVVIGLGKLVGFSARAGMEFEDLKDSLDTVFGSVEAGDKQFKRILNFAQTTPFQIDTVTKAFISLGSVGIEPTSRMMQVFADTASVAVDQRGAFEALIRVVQRAEAGALGLQELNMLADRGIDVFKGLKDELGLSRLELSDFGQTADGAKIIVDSLVNVLEKQFGGAMVNKMDNLSVAISNMQIAFKNLGNEIFMGPLGIALKSMVEMTSRIVNNIAVAMAELRGAGLGITLEAPKITTEMDFDEMQKERAKAAEANIKAIEDKLNELKAPEKILTKEVAMLKLIGSFFTDTDMSSEDEAGVSANLTEELEKQKEALKAATMTESEANSERIKSLLIQGKMASVMGLVQKHQEGLLGDTKLLTFGQEKLNEIYTKYKDLLGEININSAPDLKKALDDMATATDDSAKSFKEVLAPAIQQISLQFTNDFVNALLDGKNGLESFKNFARNIVAQIISTFLQLAVVNKILNTVFSGANDGKGLGLPELAGGGRTQGGQATLVGERGPEIFVPDSGGVIMNNMNSKNALGGGGVTVVQNNNFALGVGATARAEVQKMLPQIVEVTKGAVADAAMRGGNYRRALQGG